MDLFKTKYNEYKQIGFKGYDDHKDYEFIEQNIDYENYSHEIREEDKNVL